MSKGVDSGFPLGFGGALVLGCVWTAVAGTVWQWGPILGACAAVYGVAKALAPSEDEGQPKGPKQGGRKKGCC